MWSRREKVGNPLNKNGNSGKTGIQIRPRGPSEGWLAWSMANTLFIRRQGRTLLKPAGCSSLSALRWVPPVYPGAAADRHCCAQRAVLCCHGSCTVTCTPQARPKGSREGSEKHQPPPLQSMPCVECSLSAPHSVWVSGLVTHARTRRTPASAHLRGCAWPDQC